MTIRRSSICAVGVICACLAAPALAKDVPSSVTRQTEVVKPKAKLEAVHPTGTGMDCATFIQNLWGWVNEKKGGSDGDHRIGAKMARVKIQSRGARTYPWGHGAYSEGAFGWSGQNLTGRFKVLFSDRKSSSGARFDAGKSDIEDITLYHDGHVEIVLRSWGNTVLTPDHLQCYPEGFLTGIVREGNGVSLISFALRKEEITPGSHPAALWP
jgi:hypothetical protein